MSSSRFTACFPTIRMSEEPAGHRRFRRRNVPTRVNSPSDVAFDERDAGSGLSFSTTLLSPSFTALNSVTAGRHPPPSRHIHRWQWCGHGQEVEFDVTFATAFTLPADHYFFVPQVQLDDGDFFWLSAPKPITGGTGTFRWATCRAGRAMIAMEALSPTGCASARTSPHQGPIQRGVLADRRRGSRALDLGHDGARLRWPRFRRLSACEKGLPRQRRANRRRPSRLRWTAWPIPLRAPRPRWPGAGRPPGRDAWPARHGRASNRRAPPRD